MFVGENGVQKYAVAFFDGHGVLFFEGNDFSDSKAAGNERIGSVHASVVYHCVKGIQKHVENFNARFTLFERRLVLLEFFQFAGGNQMPGFHSLPSFSCAVLFRGARYMI